MAGRFITVEGGEGAGKTTQITALKKRLNDLGIDVVVTREPGGSPGAEAIREVILSGKAKDLGVRGEALLFAAARADHVDTIIRPALAKGQWVISDRFADSTRVYQGEGGLDDSYLDLLETVAVDGIRPDLTILIDIPAKIGLARVSKRATTVAAGGPDRFEAEDTKTHERRRQLFLNLARKEPERFAVIDGTEAADHVEKDIWSAVELNFESDLSLDNTPSTAIGGR